MLKEKFYSAADKGDCEVVGEDGHASVSEGCMNEDGDDFLKFRIPDGFSLLFDHFKLSTARFKIEIEMDRSSNGFQFYKRLC